MVVQKLRLSEIADRQINKSVVFPRRVRDFYLWFQFGNECVNISALISNSPNFSGPPSAATKDTPSHLVQALLA